MSERRIGRIVLAGTGSGCGKTTVTCAVLGALKDSESALRAFKCGPDYLDPMFHTEILGVPCRNLDSFLLEEQTLLHLFGRACPQDGAVAVVEGVMGYYDGLGGSSVSASTHHIAQILDAPVVLVVSPKGVSLSLAAQLQGFVDFSLNRISGVILNEISPGSYPMYRQIIQENTGLKVFGYLPRIPEAGLPDRHLGLVAAAEVPRLQEKLRLLAQQARQTIDLEALCRLAHSANPIRCPDFSLPAAKKRVRIAVAKDEAFCFYYQDNLELLSLFGAEPVEFSPLADTGLPDDVDGMLIGGGYPELHVRRLAENLLMQRDIRTAAQQDMPILAECGGFALLGQSLASEQGESWPMARVLQGHAVLAPRLAGDFGYCTLTARRPNMLCDRGATLRAHSFHYLQTDHPGDDFRAEKSSGRQWNCIHAHETLYAGFPHLHLWGCVEAAQRFTDACATHRARRTGVTA